jgi:hypothetical protein
MPEAKIVDDLISVQNGCFRGDNHLRQIKIVEHSPFPVRIFSASLLHRLGMPPISKGSETAHYGIHTRIAHS